VVSALVLLALCAPAGAQIVRWTDERGDVHIGDLESVPERYRSSAEMLSQPQVPAPSGGRAGAGPGRAASVGSGSAAIHFRPGQAIMAIARINGSAVVSLLIDTGADTTTIHSSVMRALGVDLRDAPTKSIRGIGGLSRARVVTLDRLDVGGATVAPIQVDVMDTGLPGHGLIGRDFLGHFEVGLDNQAGILTLHAR
jgi:clan AA aspartic protease (TIGR02281 family)